LIDGQPGPGVYEVAIQYNDPLTSADNAHLFKTTAKSIGLNHGIMPTFMAKPHNNLPGCSGHIHVSLAPLWEKSLNLFARSAVDGIVGGEQMWKDLKGGEDEVFVNEHVSGVLRCFLAGVLEGLPSVMACFAPTINR
jgi:glutamine synthetase